MTTPAPAAAAPAAAAPAPFKYGLPVPAILWDAFEETLRANMRRLAKDVAKTLGQSETPLIEALFKGGGATVKPYIFEEAAAADAAAPTEKEIDMRCDYLCQMPGGSNQILQTCGQPIVWSAAPACTRCTEHLYAKPSAPLPSHMQRLTSLEPAALDDADGPLFAAEDGTVYDKTYTVKGRYNFSSKKLVLFEGPAPS
jgi:hypothetical protein